MHVTLLKRLLLSENENQTRPNVGSCCRMNCELRDAFVI